MTPPPFPPPSSGRAHPEVSHLRAPVPIVFPEEEDMPEGYAHLILRTFLFQLLRYALGPSHSVGSDQFVYWNAKDPRRCLSPDVFVRLGVAQTSFGSWKTWEQGGPPDLAVEIVSPNEGDGVPWQETLDRYHELGVRELVRFDPEGEEGKRLRAWDRVREDLVERVVTDDATPCLTLGRLFCVTPVDGQPAGLRLRDDTGALVPTEVEAQARRVAALERELAAQTSGR